MDGKERGTPDAGGEDARVQRNLQRAFGKFVFEKGPAYGRGEKQPEKEEEGQGPEGG